MHPAARRLAPRQGTEIALRLKSHQQRRRRFAFVTALAVSLLSAVASQVRFSDAAFTALKSNPGNSLAAAASFQRNIASGTYTGNGTDNRNISGLGFQPDLVIIKSSGAQGTVIRTRTMTGDGTKPLFGATALATNRIQALLGDGFQVGTDATVNTNGTIYQWFAATTNPGAIATGSYTGNGLASRSISGLGYSPEAVILMSAGAHAPVLRIAPMTTSFRFETGTGTAAAVTALGADGFTVGNSTSTNSNNVAYHWIAVNEASGLVDTGSYAGNNTSARSITGVGFAPAIAIVRSSSTTTSRAGIWRPLAVTGTSSLHFSATANISNGITALSADGFVVGTDVNVNANANPYAYVALADPLP